MLRFFIAIPLLVHGAAHFSGFLASWTKKDQGFKDNPWILSNDVTMKTPLGRAFGIIWLLTMIAFFFAGVAVIMTESWWLEAALAGSVFSLIVIIPWWKTVVYGAKIGTIFDLIIIGFVLSPWSEKIMEIISQGME
jgi:cytochrome c biogenesis protein CcdA